MVSPGLRNHWHYHSRFYLSAALAVVVWALSFMLEGRLRLVLAGDVFYGAYLIMAGFLADKFSATELRKRAAVEDEGALLIILLTLAAVGVTLFSLFAIVREEKSDPLLLALSIASVPLGWFTLHVILAFRYAHMYYEKAKGKTPGDAGGLVFPGTKEPCGWDFVYHSFVIGMTAQVSDLDVTSTTMRKLTWAHSVVSFFYNTVLIALAVNIAVQSGG